MNKWSFQQTELGYSVLKCSNGTFSPCSSHIRKREFRTALNCCSRRPLFSYVACMYYVSVCMCVPLKIYLSIPNFVLVQRKRTSRGVLDVDRCSSSFVANSKEKTKLEGPIIFEVKSERPCVFDLSNLI